MKTPHTPNGPKRPHAPGPDNPTGEPPASAPIPPAWLTEGGRAAWDELLAQGAMVALLDSMAFGMVANLAGACAQCWASGGVPPTRALVELRRSMAVFGIVGAASRPTVPIRPKPESVNPFKRSARRLDP